MSIKDFDSFSQLKGEENETHQDVIINIVRQWLQQQGFAPKTNADDLTKGYQRFVRLGEDYVLQWFLNELAGNVHVYLESIKCDNFGRTVINVSVVKKFRGPFRDLVPTLSDVIKQLENDVLSAIIPQPKASQSNEIQPGTAGTSGKAKRKVKSFENPPPKRTTADQATQTPLSAVRMYRKSSGLQKKFGRIELR
ncbi:hypothetical protein HA402_007387 [Bradysia odoriphaga]|nr:hypothetical protein HA402_007387 [Bradysia odoriphaga]